MRDRIIRLWCDVTNRVRELLLDERGASAVEYAIVASLIAAVIVVAVRELGNETISNFEISMLGW